MNTKPSFAIFTGAMSVFTKDIDGVARKFIRATASSSVKDLHGDEIVGEAIQKMAAAAKGSDMTIFLNHKYNVPEDVFGTTVNASAIQRGVDSTGAAIWDMDIEASLNETNPRAVQTYAALEGGVKLGVSIGAMIEDWEPIDQKAGPYAGLRIKDLNLLEASIVGIPANPRSWVDRGVAAIKSFTADEDRAATLELIAGSVETTALAPLVLAATCSAKSDDAQCSKPAGHDGQHSYQSKSADDVLTDEAPPTVDDEVAPDVSADADVTPEPEIPADDATPTAPTEDSVPLANGLLADGFDLLIKTYSAQIQAKDEQIASLTTERDEALAALGIAKSIVEKIASLPLGKKTSFKYQVSAFRQDLSGIYTEEFLSFLERKPQT